LQKMLVRPRHRGKGVAEGRKISCCWVCERERGKFRSHCCGGRIFFVLRGCALPKTGTACGRKGRKRSGARDEDQDDRLGKEEKARERPQRSLPPLFLADEPRLLHILREKCRGELRREQRRTRSREEGRLRGKEPSPGEERGVCFVLPRSMRRANRDHRIQGKKRPVFDIERGSLEEKSPRRGAAMTPPCKLAARSTRASQRHRCAGRNWERAGEIRGRRGCELFCARIRLRQRKID